MLRNNIIQGKQIRTELNGSNLKRQNKSKDHKLHDQVGILF